MLTPDASWHETDLVHAPDVRRKKLLQKLAAQGAGPRGVPVPGLAGAGRSFGGGGRSVHPHITGPSNTLASVLARLGVGGAGGMGEVSPGPGMGIDYHPPHPPIGLLPGGNPIPIPGAPPVAPITPTAGSSAPVDSGGGGSFPDGGGIAGSDASVRTGYGDTTSKGIAGSDASVRTGFGGGAVPLGGGLYYDPITDTVIGGSGSAGSSIRRL